MATSKESSGSDVMMNVVKAILANSIIANGVIHALDIGDLSQVAERSVS